MNVPSTIEECDLELDHLGAQASTATQTITQLQGQLRGMNERAIFVQGVRAAYEVAPLKLSLVPDDDGESDDEDEEFDPAPV